MEKLEMESKPVSKNKFLEAFSSGKDVYVKKPKSWQRKHLWWQDDNRWFINIADDKRIKGEGTIIDESFWINKNNLSLWVNGWENEGFKFYINE